MAEIDTKSIESVQAAICFFGEKDEQKKIRFISKDGSPELDIESLMKDLTNLKVQLEAKDSAHKQDLLKLDHYQKTVDELSSLLKTSEIEKDELRIECEESRARVEDLEASISKITSQLAEYTNLREQLSHVLRELKDTQGQLLQLDVELSAAKEAKFESLTKAEEMENSLSLETVKSEGLLRHVAELNETIMRLKMTAREQEEEKLEMMPNLEKQLLEKSEQIDALQKDLDKANSLHKSCEKVAFDALNELDQMKEDLELREKWNSDLAACISLLETDLQELKQELCRANEEKEMLIRDAEEMRVEVEKARNEMNEARERENAAEIEKAVLRSEIHKGRSKVAAAEAEEAKEECRNLKATASTDSPLNHIHQNSSKFSEALDMKLNTGDREAEDKNSDVKVTIPKEEYDILIMKAEGADKIIKPGQEGIPESDMLKKELEIAGSKIAEFRARAEQAISRAEVAERGKVELEERINKWKEHKARRKAALAALHEASVPNEIVEASGSKDSNSYRYSSDSKVYQPLSKMLNMKF